MPMSYWDAFVLNITEGISLGETIQFAGVTVAVAGHNGRFDANFERVLLVIMDISYGSPVSFMIAKNTSASRPTHLFETTSTNGAFP